METPNVRLAGETVELLQGLIRNRCVNDGSPGSGQEVRNAELLRDFLGDAVNCQTFQPEPGRTSLVARIEGRDRSAPSICLMGHTDRRPASARSARRPRRSRGRGVRARQPTQRVPHRYAHVAALREEARAAYPEANVIAALLVGCTDARFYRRKGAIAYGAGLFSRKIDLAHFAARFHGLDERVDCPADADRHPVDGGDGQHPAASRSADQYGSFAAPS